MSIYGVGLEEAGRWVLLTGNEAVARGAIESGVKYAAAYPGSPSSEVLATLAQLAGQFGYYAEWSVNEKVAIEGAAAASFAGLRSLTIMKPDGFNVALDFATSVTLSGCKGGMVLVVGDDPAAHSSSKEEDSRNLAKTAHLPILEPADIQETKELTKAAFVLSETLHQPVVVRCVTRICHASGNVELGEIAIPDRKPAVGKAERYITNAMLHPMQDLKLNQAAQWAEKSSFNSYEGPGDALEIIIACGPSWVYAREAIELLGLREKVGLLKLGSTWPLPQNFILEHLKHAEKVIFAEEIEPFMEENVLALAALHLKDIGPTTFYGKRSGHVAGKRGPGIGELDVDAILKCLSTILGVSYQPPKPADYGSEARKFVQAGIPSRELAFCAGCPHRASYWAIRTALELDGRQGIVLGDIGCYTMALVKTGWSILQTVHCMGAGAGLAGGFGQLERFGFEQPVIAVAGDSTFYHAVIPSLINARFNKAQFLVVVLDNETTAMTGHQPHPGSRFTAMGEEGGTLSIEQVIHGLGIPVTICDPYQVEETTATIHGLLREGGIKALILRRACALVAARGVAKPRVYVDAAKCIGDSCGCNRFCSKVFSCPANIWDAQAGKARIDEAVCNGCGVCASLCPQNAIVVERVVG